MKKSLFRRFGMNTYRLFSSGILFAVVTVCLLADNDVLLHLPPWIYWIGTVCFAAFPVCDMIRGANRSLYKNKQFACGFEENNTLVEEQFIRIKRRYDRGALYSMAFWLAFLTAVGVLHHFEVIDDLWIVFFFAMSNFCVYFAIFFWCPFHKIFIRSRRCLDCRIFNWDAFFSFSFLIFLPSVYSAVLVPVTLLSLVRWEVSYHCHPRRFFVYSNKKLSCENCDLEHCKNHHLLDEREKISKN